jgi:hypothetical protein
MGDSAELIALPVQRGKIRQMLIAISRRAVPIGLLTMCRWPTAPHPPGESLLLSGFRPNRIGAVAPHFPGMGSIRIPGKETGQVPGKGKVHLIGLMGREAYGKGGGLRAVVHAQLGEQG